MSKDDALLKIENLIFASVTEFEKGEAHGFLEACLSLKVITQSEFEAFCLRV